MEEPVRLLKDNPATASKKSVDELETAIADFKQGNQELADKVDRLSRKRRK